MSSDEERTQDFYTMPRDRGKPTIMEPYPYSNTGSEEDEVLMTSLVAPILSRSGEFAGVVGIDMELSFMLSVVEAAKPYDRSGSGLFSQGGTYIAYYDKDKVGGNVNEEPDMAAFAEAIGEGSAYSADTMSEAFGGAAFRSVTPIGIGDTGQTWAFMTTVPLRTVLLESGFTSFQMMLSISNICLVVLLALLALILSRLIATPVSRTAKTIRLIAEGEGDLGSRLRADSKDETGDLARNFNAFVEKLAAMVAAVRRVSLRLDQVSDEMAASTRDNSRAAEGIGATARSLKEKILSQSASVAETAGTVEQITRNIESLNRSIETQASNVSQSSASIQQMIASIKSIALVIDRSAASFVDLQEAAEAGKTTLDDLGDMVRRISLQSQSLGEANEIISGIAAQTNLLAMNAAIEAAHAGEAGKGFAVVADEIRHLAEDSAQQSSAIGEDVSEISQSIEAMVSQADLANKSFALVAATLARVADSEQEIKQSMVEQSSASGEILESLARINDITSEVSVGSQEMTSGSSAILEEIRRLAELTRSIQEGMDEVSAAAQAIGNAAGKALALSDSNRELASALIADVGRFKTDRADKAAAV